MSTILLILIILICVVLSFFVLIQNPKGGGMAGTFGGFGNSVMGAKQSSDAVEKGTWYAMGALALVVLLSFVLMDKPTNNAAAGNEAGPALKATTAPAQVPATTPAPAAQGQQGTPAPTGGSAPAPTGAAPASDAPAPTSGSAEVPAPPTDG